MQGFVALSKKAFLITIFNLIGLSQMAKAQELPKNWQVSEWKGSWEEERNERQAQLDSFLQGDGRTAFQWFRNVPLGHTGLPTVLFRLLPELYLYNVAPENAALTAILMEYKKMWGDTGVYGVLPFPTDFKNNGTALRSRQRQASFGLGWTQPTEAPIEFLPKVNIHLTFVSCSSCHTGRVVLENGGIQYLYGAPTTEYDHAAFSGALGTTGSLIPDDEETLNLLAKTIVRAMNLKPAGFFLGNPLEQMKNLDPLAQELTDRLFWNLDAKKILKTIKSRLGLRTRIVSLLKNGSTGPYDKPNSPDIDTNSPGQLDAFGFGGAIIATLGEDLYKSQAEPEIEKRRWFLANAIKYLKPKGNVLDVSAELAERQKIRNITEIYGDSKNWLYDGAAKVDPLSIWQENAAWRVGANWDGSQRSAGARAISTSLAITADPSLVSVDGAAQMDVFMKGLTPPPYPFAIDKTLASKGQVLFEKNCARCHAPKVDRIFKPSEIGVDPGRAMQITEPVREGLLALFWKTCKAAAFCGRLDQDESQGLESNDSILIPRTEETMGYAAMPLDGIWARAPYLHNGSVPTLRALLTGDRPTTFWRGNIRYNQKDVGFETTDPKLKPYVSMSASARPFDTRLDGNSNKGHLTEVVDGTAVNGTEADGQAIDWSRKEYQADLEALLEYLKSL